VLLMSGYCKRPMNPSFGGRLAGRILVS
jgi:hypothetical protein